MILKFVLPITYSLPHILVLTQVSQLGVLPTTTFYVGSKYHGMIAGDFVNSLFDKS